MQFPLFFFFHCLQNLFWHFSNLNLMLLLIFFYYESFIDTSNFFKSYKLEVYLFMNRKGQKEIKKYEKWMANALKYEEKMFLFFSTCKYSVFTFLFRFLIEQFRRYNNIFFLIIALLQAINLNFIFIFFFNFSFIIFFHYLSFSLLKIIVSEKNFT